MGKKRGGGGGGGREKENSNHNIYLWAITHYEPSTFHNSDQPMFLVYVLLSLMALFKSYPCMGDLTLPLALLPLWAHTFTCT